jgi:hypothetical protein
MKLLEQLKSLKSIQPLEIGVLILFIIFIIFPFKLPLMVADVFNSSLGFLLLFVVAIYLFFYTNPILGVIFILVAFELVRRSSHLSNDTIYVVRDHTNQQTKDMELEKLNPSTSISLEEEVIQKMAPARNEFIKGDMSNFKPNMVSNIGASMFE